jgi:hypothetical protein
MTLILGKRPIENERSYSILKYSFYIKRHLNCVYLKIFLEIINYFKNMKEKQMKLFSAYSVGIGYRFLCIFLFSAGSVEENFS